MSKWIHIENFPTPYGDLLLGSHHEALVLCDWRYRRSRESIDRRIREGLQANFVEAGSPAIEKCKAQLSAYFDGTGKTFDLPIRLLGSEFQQGVWTALMDIPYGKTQSYASLSRRLGCEKAIRAVAKANGDNALSIIVPCHRILGSDGSLTGYAGGLRVKKKLLQLEGASLQQELNFES